MDGMNSHDAKVRRAALEEAEQAALDDLLEGPGIAAEAHRFDGGASARAARRIATAIRALAEAEPKEPR